ncbi:MAG: HAMP domain-containing sensor histidine kinase [Burkholderiales bacterium]
MAPLEPILHPSAWRIGWLGALTLVGHPLFGWVWTSWLPQPWESMSLRLAFGGLGVVLLILAAKSNPFALSTQVIFNLVLWSELPFLFSWLYLCNGGNAVWLASAVSMVLIYYQTVDWRIATVGIASGAIIGSLSFNAFGPAAPQILGVSAATNSAVLGFTWCMAIVLGFSTANQRRLHLRRTLTTMGIMAHELRTPLATVSLVSQALRGVAQGADGKTGGAIEPLANRLETLARNMNHQIDTQLVNARMLRLTPHSEPIDVGQLVLQMTEQYPFRNAQERNAIEVHVRQNFVFDSSPALFMQVFENLLKNALAALARADAPLTKGDVAIDIATAGGKGRLTFSDRGVGILPALRHRIFEPFFSSDNHNGHGLGLAFCRRVVKSAGGSIRVHSELGRGASFVIELPLARLRGGSVTVHQCTQATP